MTELLTNNDKRILLVVLVWPRGGFVSKIRLNSSDKKIYLLALPNTEMIDNLIFTTTPLKQSTNYFNLYLRILGIPYFNEFLEYTTTILKTI